MSALQSFVISDLIVWSIRKLILNRWYSIVLIHFFVCSISCGSQVSVSKKALGEISKYSQIYKNSEREGRDFPEEILCI